MKRVWGMTLTLLLLGLASAALNAGGEGTPLFNGKDMSGWKFEPASAEKAFTVKDGMIVVSGKPAGYFYTDKSFKNYVLTFDWQYARPGDLTDDSKFKGNSGLLVHIQPPQKVWPKCVEVQGMWREHGRTLAIGGAKGNFKMDKEALEKSRKPVGEWNTTEVVCKNGSITSKVNGVPVTTGGESALMEGPIGFQSEGAEIHFKNIRIKVTD